jgi:heat shock protein HslJ
MDFMTRARRGLLAFTVLAGVVLTAAPAMAGDSAAPLRSPVGDWKTRTNTVKQTITFDRNGTVYGDAGCNRFTGAYKVKGDRISIGPLATTLMACPEPIMAAEATFLTRLNAAVAYQATDAVLKVFAPKDLIRFTAN